MKKVLNPPLKSHPVGQFITGRTGLRIKRLLISTSLLAILCAYNLYTSYHKASCSLLPKCKYTYFFCCCLAGVNYIAMKRNCSFNPVFRTLATTRCYSLGLFIQYPVAIELTTKPLWGEDCVYCRIHYCTIFLTQRTMNGWPRVIRKQADNQTARQTTRQTNQQNDLGDDATEELGMVLN